MHDGVHPSRTTGSARARQLAAAGLISGALVAGCGGGAGGSTLAKLGGSTSSGPPTQAALDVDQLAYSKCMRANGVPDFPDPTAGGGLLITVGSGIDPASPGFMAAEAKCQKLVPGGAPPGPGTPTHPSRQALGQMLTVAQCMRHHGIANFPDPRTTVPPRPPASVGGGGVISDIDGVILVFPGTIDEQSPLFTRAAAVCEFPLHGHR